MGSGTRETWEGKGRRMASKGRWGKDWRGSRCRTSLGKRQGSREEKGAGSKNI